MADDPVSSGPPPPDSRFVQANERTFLAWIRTSLAMMTFGFVIARLGAWLEDLRQSPAAEPTYLTTFLGAGFVVLAVLVDVLAFGRYWQVLRALRAGQPVPEHWLPVLFGVLVIALGIGVIAYVFSVVL